MSTEIQFLTQIIKANRLHEPYCVAFDTYKGVLANPFASMIEKECHCWLDKDNKAEDGKGFGIYNVQDKTLLHEAFFINRYYTRRHILAIFPNLSEDPKSDDYWSKHYLIVPVQIRPTAEGTDD
jgi:hypothetical protein